LATRLVTRRAWCLINRKTSECGGDAGVHPLEVFVSS
jgi:hypothetical protein